MTRLEENWSLTRETVGDGRLSVVMPVRNLAGSIARNLEATADLFEAHGVNAELVPVDDGSDDGTAGEIARLAASFPRGRVAIKPVYLERNGGKGAALKAGFEASSGEYVMLLDGDLDIHPKQTPWFFREMVEKGADAVIGSKRHRRSVVQYPWHRRLASFCSFALVRIFVGLPITDTQTGMKLFRRETLRDAIGRMLVKTYAFDLELLAIAHSRGAKIAEAPVVIRFGQKFGCLKANTVWTMAKDSLAVFYRLRILKYYDRVEIPPKLGREPLVSIVIACPNRSWMLDECLAAIEKQTYRNFETIVLDDEKTGKIRPAEKRNIGICEAKGEIVAFIDDDAYPDPKWLEYAVRHFGDETVGAVGGPGVTPPGDPYMAKVGGRVYSNLMVSGNYRYRYRAGGVCRDVDDYPSCNLFVRKRLFDSTGGYRTDFWPGEDTLLCKDIVDGGSRIFYDPWVIVYHHRRALFAPHLRQLGRYAFHRGYFAKRFPSNSLRLPYFIPSAFVLYCVLWLAAVAVPTPDSMPLWAWTAWHGFICVPMMAYLVLAAVTSFSINPLTWLLTVCGVASTHFVYGVRFIQGLAAKKAPCEFIGKDHV